jgi:hypothetical protein
MEMRARLRLAFLNLDWNRGRTQRTSYTKRSVATEHVRVSELCRDICELELLSGGRLAICVGFNVNLSSAESAP